MSAVIAGLGKMTLADYYINTPGLPAMECKYTNNKCFSLISYWIGYSITATYISLDKFISLYPYREQY